MTEVIALGGSLALLGWVGSKVSCSPGWPHAPYVMRMTLNFWPSPWSLPSVSTRDLELQSLSPSQQSMSKARVRFVTRFPSVGVMSELGLWMCTPTFSLGVPDIEPQALWKWEKYSWDEAPLYEGVTGGSELGRKRKSSLQQHKEWLGFWVPATTQNELVWISTPLQTHTHEQKKYFHSHTWAHKIRKNPYMQEMKRETSIKGRAHHLIWWWFKKVFHPSRGAQTWDHMHPKIAMNVTQHKIIILLKTVWLFFFKTPWLRSPMWTLQNVGHAW